MSMKMPTFIPKEEEQPVKNKYYYMPKSQFERIGKRFMDMTIGEAEKEIQEIIKSGNKELIEHINKYVGVGNAHAPGKATMMEAARKAATTKPTRTYSENALTATAPTFG